MPTHYRLKPGENPKITLLSTPANNEGSPWSKMLHETRQSALGSELNGKVSEVMRQEKLRVGDLVDWSPTGVPGVWRIRGIDRQHDLADSNPESIKESIRRRYAKPAKLPDDVEWRLEDIASIGPPPESLPIEIVSAPRGKVALDWMGGWKGYEGRGLRVCVRIEDVRKLSPLEALAICAT